ncbi:hypothetical protein [Pusillimonas sp. NJUB218]|uniref:hypothetical protein n=1 Tax=Pusillimonas sp. NJUB218 TaxID=2023230 RepID=UPI000F4CE235|nr:hypothetical protein [Pusillimonas sp. NJUB218]ROT44542.1 hypothetical protein CHR62_10890 [Pusillimonas sp. NJUB218]
MQLKLTDPYPELPIEYGPHGRGVGKWVTEQKHKYLADYIIATQMARRKFPQCVLIDPFCGPGRLQVEGEAFTRPGGSVIAYSAASTTKAPFTKILIGDIDQSRVQANHKRLTAAGAKVEAFVGPASETVHFMAKAVPHGALGKV